MSEDCSDCIDLIEVLMPKLDDDEIYTSGVREDIIQKLQTVGLNHLNLSSWDDVVRFSNIMQSIDKEYAINLIEDFDKRNSESSTVERKIEILELKRRYYYSRDHYNTNKVQEIEEEIMKLNPDEIDMRLDKARRLINSEYNFQNQREQGVQLLEVILKHPKATSKNKIDAYWQKVLYLEKCMKDKTKTVDKFTLYYIYEDMIKLDPESESVYEKLIEHSYNVGWYEKCREYIDKYFDLRRKKNPKDPIDTSYFGDKDVVAVLKTKFRLEEALRNVH